MTSNSKSGNSIGISPDQLASLDSDQAGAIFEQGKEVVVFTLLAMARQLAVAGSVPDNPATPSGMIPVYEKPPAKKRRKKPGAKADHVDSRRAKSERIDHYQTHRADACRDCSGPLNQCSETRTRYVGNIPEIESEVTKHKIHRDWCPKCKKKVEATVTDALPGSTLGLRVLVLSAWLHCCLGNTLSQIVEVFNFHLQLKLSAGGLIQMWYRLQELLLEWYEQILRESLESAVLHGGEMGRRVDGKTHCLWCFGTSTCTCYMIDRSRGSPALVKFFTTELAGMLVTDFWVAYNAVVCADRQMCLVHLLRELEQTVKYKSPGENWAAFEKILRRLLGDAIRLWKSRDELASHTLASRRQRLDNRLSELIVTDLDDGNAKRLIKRLLRHQEDLFTFLDKKGVPFENNHAERLILPAVILRKNSYGN